MNEHNEKIRMAASRDAGRSRATTAKEKPKVRRRVKATVEEAIKLIFEEDGPLLKRLAD